MTETEHCAENALAERINGILKSEYGLGGQFKTKADSPALRREAAQPTPEIIQEASRHTVKFKPGLDLRSLKSTPFPRLGLGKGGSLGANRHERASDQG